MKKIISARKFVGLLSALFLFTIMLFACGTVSPPTESEADIQVESISLSRANDIVYSDEHSYVLRLDIQPANATNLSFIWSSFYVGDSFGRPVEEIVLTEVALSGGEEYDLCARRIFIMSPFTDQIAVSVCLSTDVRIRATCVIDYIERFDIGNDVAPLLRMTDLGDLSRRFTICSPRYGGSTGEIKFNLNGGFSGRYFLYDRISIKPGTVSGGPYAIDVSVRLNEQFVVDRLAYYLGIPEGRVYTFVDIAANGMNFDFSLFEYLFGENVIDDFGYFQSLIGTSGCYPELLTCSYRIYYTDERYFNATLTGSFYLDVDKSGFIFVS